MTVIFHSVKLGRMFNRERGRRPPDVNPAAVHRPLHRLHDDSGTVGRPHALSAELLVPNTHLSNLLPVNMKSVA